MITQTKAERFIREWADAWNRQDLEAILAYYADDVELTSPFVVQVLGDPAGTLRGKAQVKSYFAMGLAMFPDLFYEVHLVCAGVQSIAVVYRALDDTLAAEVMVLNAEGRINRVLSHYQMEAT